MSKKNKVTKELSSEDSDSDNSDLGDSSNNGKSNKNNTAKITSTDPTQSAQKKRGRPKKIVVQKQIQKISLPIKEKEPEEEQLILRIPIFDDDNEDDNSSERNMFTMKDDSDNEDNEDNINPFKRESIKLIDSLTETEDINSESSNEYDVKTLLTELKKRDQIIKKLKSQPVNQKQASQFNDNIPLFTKDAHKKLINLKLFDMNNGNTPIVVDKTNIACWWCSYNFDTMPCFIPDRYVNGKFYVFGCFCTYSCALKYNTDMKDYRVTTRTGLMKDLCNTIFGNTEMLTEAPEKEILQKFGGPMPIDEFRNHHLLCKKEFKIKIPPMIPLVATVEETYRDPSMNPTNFGKFKR